MEPLLRERKDSRTPVKKNRRRLDPTEEEEDNGSGSGGSGSHSPRIAVSPRQEMKIKVRQISQGVEDIRWQNMQHITDKDEDAEIDVEASEVTLEPALELIMSSDNLPPDTPNRLCAGPESGEKGLKRKFLERGTSQGPMENEEPSNRAPEPLKRPRDESDKDDNPRETKRPSPPPSPPRSSQPSKASKFVCFFFLFGCIILISISDVFAERIYGICICQLPICISQRSKYIHVWQSYTFATTIFR